MEQGRPVRESCGLRDASSRFVAFMETDEALMELYNLVPEGTGFGLGSKI